MAPKSGSPVLGHMDVNSGQSIATSKSRSGRGLGNVSSVGLVDITKFYQRDRTRLIDSGVRAR
jgi:hypothetical protein